MTTTAVGDAEHDLVLHRGTAELVDLMVPFVRDGAAARDTVIVLGEPEFVTALLAAAPGLPTLRALPTPQAERFPARDLHRFGQMLTELDGTASRVRVVNQMPVMTTARWLEWRRYEAAVNVVIEPHRVWGKCGYDARGLEPGMVSDLRASHPHVQTPAGRRPSADFDQLEARTRRYLDVPGHPAESAEPTLVMSGVTAAEARRAVRGLAARSALPPTVQETVVLATSEAVMNAVLHGSPPVLLRVWTAGEGGMTVAVSDAGSGPHPLVGMLPGAPGGFFAGGMWIVHMLLSDIHHRRSSEGYTVTFAADETTTLPYGVH